MKSYSQKEIHIFNSVLELAAKGKSFHELTASEIAAAADMGKGTLYDYFESKEEILINTVLYCTEQELNEFAAAMTQESFVELTEHVLRKVQKNAKTGSSILMFLLKAEKTEYGLTLLAERYIPHFEDLSKRLHSLCMAYLEKGCAEQVIFVEDTEYAVITVLTIFKGFACSLNCMAEEEKGISQQKRIEYTEKMLIKALN